MKNFKKILAPTDLSEVSALGVRQALDIAHANGAEVIIYHVVAVSDEWFAGHEHQDPVRDLLSLETRRLDRFLREKFPEFTGLVEIIQKVELGHPAVNIVEVAKREDVDLIVISTHGRTGIGHMLLGSVTEKVVARASCPVLTIPAAGRAGSKAKAA
ncbi:MAG: universal stress protein [Deltaproteobacteria bacterium]|nr:universal stress protein [Deltaproteobacteria bacterium]